MTVGSPEVVIATKLFAPSLRHEPVARPRLHARLRDGLSLPLTLVVAPAGWGKSTLISEWLRQDGIMAGWVSLDRGDDDAKRFWHYLLLAANQGADTLVAAALRRLDAAGSDVLRDVLPIFVNELAAFPNDVVVVLDDYHLVSNAQVHESIATLLDRCPRQLHLILGTRADPPLPLSRLRVRGDLVELRADHLRFSGGGGRGPAQRRAAAFAVSAGRRAARRPYGGVGSGFAAGGAAAGGPCRPLGVHRTFHGR